MKFRAGLFLIVCLTTVTSRAQFVAHLPAPSASESSVSDPKALDMLLHAQRSPLRFRADDVISVSVYGMKEYAERQRIAEDGTVLLPFVGSIAAVGLTTQELATRIATRLSDKHIVLDPQVTVSVIAQPWVIVTVAGDVSKPGVFPAYGNLTLMDYISQAGGLNQTSSGIGSLQAPASSVVTLIREGLPEPMSIDLGSDASKSPYTRIPIFAGDQLLISKAGVVYAFGAFKNEGSFPLKASVPTTALQLAALAGGIGYQADRKDACIIRMEHNTRQVIPLDVARIIKGDTPDVALEPDDILFVPTNSMKAALKGGGASVVVALASGFLYTR